MVEIFAICHCLLLPPISTVLHQVKRAAAEDSSHPWNHFSLYNGLHAGFHSHTPSEPGPRKSYLYVDTHTEISAIFEWHPYPANWRKWA